MKKWFYFKNLTILSKDYKFEKSFWKNVYKNYEIKSLNKEIFKIELKLKNKRKDENHKISKDIVDSNDFIFMEDLTLKGMQNLWGNKIKQLGLSQLTMFIKYKAENQGNTERTSLLSECNKQSIACKKACKKRRY